jgi:uncharacterized membrane protein YdbT with pleckstrin-like domain
MFRAHPFGYLLSLLLIFAAGAGLVILLVWWIRTCGMTLIVTDRRTIIEKGILSRSSNEVLHEHIRNIVVEQTLFERIFRTGKIGISSAGQAGVEIEAAGIPFPDTVKRLIDRHRGLGLEQ